MQLAPARVLSILFDLLYGPQSLFGEGVESDLALIALQITPLVPNTCSHLSYSSFTSQPNYRRL